MMHLEDSRPSFFPDPPPRLAARTGRQLVVAQPGQSAGAGTGSNNGVLVVQATRQELLRTSARACAGPAESLPAIAFAQNQAGRGRVDAHRQAHTVS